MKYNICPIAIASPIFKWFNKKGSENIQHDNFGMSPYLEDSEKKEIINKVFKNAKIFSVNYIRIFSNLGVSENPVDDLLSDNIFEYLVSRAEYENITLLLENEPVCTINRVEHLIDFFEKFKNIKLWLDIANLFQVGEVIDKKIIKLLSEKLKYLHVKDYRINNGKIEYLPMGRGMINYRDILKIISECVPDDQEIIISIETHAKSAENKYIYSKESMENLKKELKNIL
jgi:sugar phosphate isomerase/epimerase